MRKKIELKKVLRNLYQNGMERERTDISADFTLEANDKRYRMLKEELCLQAVSSKRKKKMKEKKWSGS